MLFILSRKILNNLGFKELPLFGDILVYREVVVMGCFAVGGKEKKEGEKAYSI